MKARSTSVFPLTPTADHTGKEGFFILPTGALVSSATAALPLGVILEGAETTGKDSVGLPNIEGTVKVKLSATPGAVIAGSFLVLDGTTFGTAKLDPGSAARIQVARALEAGAANELIEAYLVHPAVLA
jgi:hypothetical protein